MSRDWTPFQHYLVEQNNIKRGYGDLFDFMESLTMTDLDGNDPVVMHPPEEMAIRREFPYLGKYLFDEFMDLHKLMSEFNGGLDFLHQKDAALGAHINALWEQPDPKSQIQRAEQSDDFLLKWFHGKLDERFHYGIRNNELLVDAICKEALQLGLSNWIVTDIDCAQVRRQIGFEDRGIYELMQVDSFPNGTHVLSIGEIDFDDYSASEIKSALDGYGYDSIKSLIKATGSGREAYGQLAEMLFELSSNFGVLTFDTFNDAVAEVERRTGLDLDDCKEQDAIPRKQPLNSQIEAATNKASSDEHNKNMETNTLEYR
ncbi:MAG: hypothetical protein IJZ42_13385 [Lachnospiraceae bacterium]|nr:hypothetical protein [Lachnospiraceae bacterium]